MDPRVYMMKNKVMRIWMSLYGLPRAGHYWGEMARKVVLELGFKHFRDIGEESLYYIMVGDVLILLLIYTDDLAVAGRKAERGLYSV